jgi:hypothetical protein
MPYIRKGNTVYKKSGKKVGSSKSTSTAKKYMRVLRAVEHGWKPSRKK